MHVEQLKTKVHTTVMLPPSSQKSTIPNALYKDEYIVYNDNDCNIQWQPTHSESG